MFSRLFLTHRVISKPSISLNIFRLSSINKDYLKSSGHNIWEDKEESKSVLNRDELGALVKHSLKAKENSYSPYSKFRVGAAVLTNEGTIYSGCNVENASYSLVICAERTALSKAVSEGEKHIKAIAVGSDLVDSFLSPCGACRQVMLELAPKAEVILVKEKDHEYKNIGTVEDLLPHSFAPHHLDEERIPSKKE